MKKFIFYSLAIIASSSAFSADADRVILERLTQGVWPYSNLNESSVKVYASGKIVSRKCQLVALQTYPVIYRQICETGALPNLAAEKVAELQTAIQDTAQGQYVSEERGVCPMLPKEVLTYWVHDAEGVEPRWVQSGYSPCGEYMDNNSPSTGKIV